MPFQAVSLSGAANGKVIRVTESSFVDTNGTLIHTAVSGTESWDELWLWAMNGDSTSRSLSVGWGGDPNLTFPARYASDLIIHSLVVAAQSRVALVEGCRLQNGLMVAAIASVTSGLVKIHGYVNRITPDE